MVAEKHERIAKWLIVESVFIAAASTALALSTAAASGTPRKEVVG